MASTSGTGNRRFVGNHPPGIATLLCTLLAFTLAACATTSTGSNQPSVTPKPRVTSVANVPLDAQLGGKTIYVTTAGRSGTQSPGCLLTLNAQTGATRWSFCPQGTGGAPAVANGVVYIAPEDGNVYALDAATGKPIWTYQRNDGSNRTGFDGYAVIAGQVVYVGSDPGFVYALDTSTGSRRWAFPTDGNPIYTTPAVANGLVYVSANRAPGFYALDANSGALRWSPQGSFTFGGAPMVADGAVYVGGRDRYLVALDGGTGAVKWSFQTGGSILARPTAGNGLVYAGSTDQNVYALDAHTGQQRWKFQTGGDAPTPLIPTGAAPILDGSVVYVGSQGGALYALEAATGKQIWSYATGSGIGSAPTVVDGAVYVTCDDGTVRALRASDGKLSWAYKAGEASFASPVAA